MVTKSKKIAYNSYGPVNAIIFENSLKKKKVTVF